jgi:hypothetical protein
MLFTSRSAWRARCAPTGSRCALIMTSTR